MSDDHFHYDQLMLKAHRGLIRDVLLSVLDEGLPGEHHFFIIFSTTHAGTRISDRLMAQYPQEMTIVMQHQYSNLKVHKDRFEIQLSFNRIPELLVIPFEAITGFVDPSVPFGLQLAGEAAAGLENSIGMLVPGLPQSETNELSQELSDQTDTPSGKYVSDEMRIKPEAIAEMLESEETSVPSIFPAKSNLRDISEDEKNALFAPDDQDEADDDKWEKDTEEEEGNANIVQLDAFRKKSK